MGGLSELLLSSDFEEKRQEPEGNGHNNSKVLLRVQSAPQAL